MADSKHDARLVLCTCPDRDVAERIAAALVGAGSAACVNIVEGLTSVYAWQGRIEKDAECLLMIKTRAAMLARLEGDIVALHPYDVPEIVALPIVAGLPAYLDWIDDSTGAPA